MQSSKIAMAMAMATKEREGNVFSRSPTSLSLSLYVMISSVANPPQVNARQTAQSAESREKDR